MPLPQVDPGYAPYDEGTKSDVWMKGVDGKPYLGWVRGRKRAMTCCRCWLGRTVAVGLIMGGFGLTMPRQACMRNVWRAWHAGGMGWLMNVLHARNAMPAASTKHPFSDMSNLHAPRLTV